MAKKSSAKILKEKGLIPNHWDLRKQLTTGQKSWITKQSNRFKQLISRPGDFTVKTVKTSTGKELKRAGYRVSGNKAVIPNSNGQKARVSVKKITTGKGSSKKVRHELSLTFDHKKEKIILENGPNFLERLAKLKPKKLRANQAYALKIGGSQLTNATFDSIADMQVYASRMRAPHARNGFDALSVVVITSMEAPFRPEFDEDDEDNFND